MYNAHKITDKVAAGKLALGSHVGFDSPFVTEMIAGCGFDFVWIDGEHSAIDRKDIQNHLMACRAAGAAGIVRVPWNDSVIIKAILDMGADGIVVPMVCSLEEAKQAAAAQQGNAIRILHGLGQLVHNQHHGFAARCHAAQQIQQLKLGAYIQKGTGLIQQDGGCLLYTSPSPRDS